MLRKIFRWLNNFIVFLTCEIEIIGVEKIPADGGCIFVSNHLGRLDVFLVYKIITREDVILAIAEKYQKYAIFRLAVDALDAIWIDRFNTDFKAMRQIITRLKDGGVLILAPEGTRSITESLIPGKPGAAYIASKTQMPVFPVALTGTEDRTVKNDMKKLKRAKITVRIGEQFRLPPLPRKDRNRFLQFYTDIIMCQIAALLPEKYRGVYSDHHLLIELISKNQSNDSYC